MIELTQDQVQALGRPAGALPKVLNPQTQEMFVLVPLAEYGRLTDQFDDGPWTDEERNLLRQEACAMLDTFGKTA